VSDNRARVRLFAQIGDSVLLYQLADQTVTSHADVPELLRAVADAYAEQHPDLPGIPPAP
jgi:protein-tyrosine phosphatase